MRNLVILVLVIALGAGVAAYLGAFDRVTEGRVEAALLDAGVSQNMAECMAPKMVDRLSLAQLKKLERLGAQDGEAAMPLSGEEALLRLERVEDREAVEVLIRAGGSCAFENFLN